MCQRCISEIWSSCEFNFSPAEEYHQRYLDKNPEGYCHIGKAQFKKAAKALVNSAAYPVPDTDSLRKSLTPTQYEVSQHSATEPPFQNEFYQTFMSGVNMLLMLHAGNTRIDVRHQRILKWCILARRLNT